MAEDYLAAQRRAFEEQNNQAALVPEEDDAFDDVGRDSEDNYRSAHVVGLITVASWLAFSGVVIPIAQIAEDAIKKSIERGGVYECFGDGAELPLGLQQVDDFLCINENPSVVPVTPFSSDEGDFRARLPDGLFQSSVKP